MAAVVWLMASDDVVQFPRRPIGSAADGDLLMIASDLSAELGMPVDVSGGERGFQVAISAPDLEALDRLCRLLQSGSA